MKKAKVRELYSFHMAAGFFTGVLFWLIILFIFLDYREEGFTLNQFISLHRDSPMFYFIDCLPFFGLIAGVVVARFQYRSISNIDEFQQIQTQRKESVNTALQDLAMGKLNNKLDSGTLDPEIAENIASLQERLRENKKMDQQTREEERQRNWTSSGLAEFGDILRTYSNDLENLSYQLISQLVRYLGINQGGFFFLEEEPGVGKQLRMTACHAYDRKKFPDKVLQWGEGLIGTVAIEKKSYYTDKIPEGYLTITSGLGKANPRYLLIVPMIINDEVFGVLELASFKPFEKYQVGFVERLAESTATTLNIMKNNFRTEQLLKETQLQAQKLANQEEEVRKNIEELKKTQQEAAMQSEQFITFTNTVNHTLIRAEYTIEGKLIYANTRFLKKLGYAGNKEVQDKPISMFVHDEDRSWFEEIWKKLSKGGEHFEGLMRHVTKLGLDLWTVATYTCARREDGSVEKILFLAFDVQEQMADIKSKETRIEALNGITCRAEFTIDGKVAYMNALFLKLLDFAQREIRDKYIFDFILPENQEMFNEIWEQVIIGNPYVGQLRIAGKFETEHWFRVSFSVSRDLYGEAEKIILLANDITREKELERNLRRQNEQLISKEQEQKVEKLDFDKQLSDLQQRLSEEKEDSAERIKVFYTFFDKLPYPALMINNLSFLLHANRKATKLFQFKLKEQVNRNITELISESQDNEVMKHFIDPSLPLREVDKRQVRITLKNNQLLETTISVTKVELQKELIYILLVHGD